MKHCAFRFIDLSTGKPTGFVGIAWARDMKELFWEIDQYGNPYSVEIAVLPVASVCSQYYGDNDVFQNPYGDIEVSENLLNISKNKWVRPDFGTYDKLGAI